MLVSRRILDHSASVKANCEQMQTPGQGAALFGTLFNNHQLILTSDWRLNLSLDTLSDNLVRYGASTKVGIRDTKSASANALPTHLKSL